MCLHILTFITSYLELTTYYNTNNYIHFTLNMISTTWYKDTTLRHCVFQGRNDHFQGQKSDVAVTGLSYTVEHMLVVQYMVSHVYMYTSKW